MLANQVKKASVGQTQIRNFSSAVYLWRNASRYAGKSGSASAKFEMPRGLPKRIEAFDDLNVKTLRIGQRHSAAIC